MEEVQLISLHINHQASISWFPEINQRYEMSVEREEEVREAVALTCDSLFVKAIHLDVFYHVIYKSCSTPVGSAAPPLIYHLFQTPAAVSLYLPGTSPELCLYLLPNYLI